MTLYFANRPVVVTDSSPSLQGWRSRSIARSDLSIWLHALTTGAQILNGQPGRLVVLSDGLATQGDTAQAITALAQQDIPVDVLLPDQAALEAWRGGQNEVSLVKLNVPPVLRQGETFGLEVTIHSLTAAEVTLNLTQGDTMLAEDVVSLEPGLNLFTFEAQAEAGGSPNV